MTKIKQKTFLVIKSLSFLFIPILMAIFPLLSFYYKNIAELSLKFLIKPFFYSMVATLFLTILILILTKNKNKAALVASLATLVFFSYGRLSNSLTSKLFIQLPNKIVLGPDKILLPIITVLFVFICFKIFKSTKTLNQIIGFLTVFLLVLVGYLTLAIAKNESQKKENLVVRQTSLQTGNQNSEITRPDIYYIVLDGYAREDILRDIYHYDNSGFIENLRKLGFYVADKARPNYIHTYLSLPSTLNMRYLDELPQKYGEKPTDGSAARKLTSDNEVTRKLKDYGYTVINFASTWEGTNESYQADITYKGDEYFKILGKNVPLDETSITFLQTTLLSPLIKEVWGDALRARTLSTFQKLPTVPFQPEEPKFIVVHIIGPHPPYVFTAEGNPIPGAEFEFADEGIEKRPKYLGQLTFISNEVLPMVQKIIENSKNRPIIILQADHGPASIFGKREDWLKNYSEEGVKERSSILYAVYFPDQNYQQFYNTITPVNTFRIVFDRYFNEGLELLPDKTYYTSYEKIYGYKDITDIK